MTLAIVAAAMLRVSILLLAALAAAAMLRRRSAALRRQVLATAVSGALVVPLAAIVLPSWHVELPQRHARSAAPGDLHAGDVESVEMAFTIPSPAAAARPAAPSPSGEAALPGLDALILTLWGAGAVVALLMLAAGVWRLAFVSRRAVAICDGPWFDALQRLAAEDRALANTVLLLSDHPSLLVAWGWRRPRILLPRGAASWSLARLLVVLEHEAEHIRRRDWPLQLAGEIVRALAWFNPLAWIAANRLRLESERACDDAVIAKGIAAREYAAQLVALARTLSKPRTWVPAPAMARSSSLEKRVAAMLDHQVARAPLTRVVRVSIVAAGLALTAAIATVAAQPQFATLRGIVRDQLGGTIPQVTVTVSQPQSGIRHEVKTDARGGFELPGLTPGNYDLEVWHAGFKTLHDALQLAAGQVATRSLSLDLGTLEETVRVVDGPSTPPGASSTQRRPAPTLGACSAEPNSGTIKPPMKLADKRARYPESLSGSGRTGRVVLQATIGVDGTVHQVRTLDATSQEFEDAATEAVRQWRFSQTLLNCVPVEVEMTVTTAFDAAGNAQSQVGGRKLGDAALPPPPPPPPPASPAPPAPR